MNSLTSAEQLIVNVENLKKLLNDKNKRLDKKTNSELDQLLLGLKTPSEKLTSEAVDNVAELGNKLLKSLFFDTYKPTQQRELHQKISISFGYWVAVNNGILKEIEYPVSALAKLANTLHDKVSLEALYEVATYLVSATDKPIMEGKDLDLNNPWRVLIMNYSIVATRTHNPDLMASAFKTLVDYFPELAPGFFKKGMSEMVRLDYPEHVRIVMERYYNQYVTD